MSENNITHTNELLDNNNNIINYVPILEDEIPETQVQIQNEPQSQRQNISNRGVEQLIAIFNIMYHIRQRATQNENRIFLEQNDFGYLQ